MELLQRVHRRTLIYSYQSLLLSLIVGFFVSCNWNPGESISWDTEILVPLANSSIGIQDFLDIGDSIIYKDKIGVLVFRDTLAEISLAENLLIPDTTILYNFQLNDYRLSPQKVSRKISLGEVARLLIDQGNILGTFILLNHKRTLPVLPDQPGLSTPPVQIKVSDLFDYARISQGTITVSVENKLPVDIANVRFSLVNAGNKNQILNGVFAQIPKNSAAQENFDLKGKTVEGELLIELSNIDFRGGTNVLIDTAASLEVNISVSALQAEEARAVFPTQTLDSANSSLTYSFTGELQDVQLKKAVVSKGLLIADVISTFEDTLMFSYTLPGVQKNGRSPNIVQKLLPAQGNTPSTWRKIFDLSGYVMDLSEGGTSYNTLLQQNVIKLLSSGKRITLDNSDSVRLEISLQGVQADYLEGYLGKGTERFTNSRNLNAFNTLGSIDGFVLENPQARLMFENSMGLKFDALLRSLVFSNTQKGRSLSFAGTLTQGSIAINGAQLPDTNRAVVTVLNFDRTNSNLKELVNLLPNRIAYDISAAYNEGVIPGAKDNFITSASRLRAILEVEAPLEGSLENLIVRDTSQIDFSDLLIDNIQSSTLKLYIENRSPLQLTLTARVLDANQRVLTTLTENSRVEAGTLNEFEQVEKATNTLLSIELDENLLSLVVNTGRYISLEYLVFSRPVGKPVKFYDSYQINAKLTGLFTYRVNAK